MTTMADILKSKVDPAVHTIGRAGGERLPRAGRHDPARRRYSTNSVAGLLKITAAGQAAG